MPRLWECPRCGTATEDYPAITRNENADYREICTPCGQIEAMEAFLKWRQPDTLEEYAESEHDIIR